MFDRAAESNQQSRRNITTAMRQESPDFFGRRKNFFVSESVNGEEIGASSRAYGETTDRKVNATVYLPAGASAK